MKSPSPSRRSLLDMSAALMAVLAILSGMEAAISPTISDEDPGEQRNLVSDPAVDGVKQRLHAILKSICRPRGMATAPGAVPEPAGAGLMVRGAAAGRYDEISIKRLHALNES